MATTGLVLKSVDRSSAAYKSGLRSGDRILAINDEPIEHELDFHYSAAAETLEVSFIRKGCCSHLPMNRPSRGWSGVAFAGQKLKRCGNRCIFCFVDQMPPDMRRTLYIKDEDYRHSFLYGNYLTLSCLSQDDFQNIVRLGLSPLYVSVHVTDPEIRRAMLKNRKSPPILDQLKILQKNDITFHTQIVVCPGHNDGLVLHRSIRDLLAVGRGVLSIAVVPVGLTRFHRNGLRLITAAEAREICSAVGKMSDDDAEKQGRRRIFLADEFFIKAGLPIPPKRYYGDFPQIENGVGLVRRLLDESRMALSLIKSGKVRKMQRMAVMTSASAGPFLAGIISRISRKHPAAQLSVYIVPNRLFGESVTVAGLLSAGDIVHAVRRIEPRPEMIVVPDVIFNHNGVTLDGYSLGRMQKKCGIPVRTASTITELLQKTGII